MRSNYKIRNTKKRNLFEVIYRWPNGDSMTIFKGTFNQCVIWMLIEIPALRDEFKEINFSAVEKIIKKTKLKNI